MEDSKIPKDAILRPLVPPGDYQVALVEHETICFFRHPKLVLTFQIIDFGEYFGTLLQRFYNVKRFIGKPRKRGDFVAPQSGDFLLEYCLACPTSRITRLDRLSMREFYDGTLVAEVATVKKNARQMELPEQIQYSVVTRLKARVTA